MRVTAAQAALAAVLTGALYAIGLGHSPPHLTHDEIKFALQAHAIAETGRDINGRFFPLYFIEPGFSVGRDPLCIYLTAMVLGALPLSEHAIRLASVLVGATGVGLAFVLARLLCQQRAVPWIVAGTLALSPTYYIHSRLALSVIYPVPFTLLWLILLHQYLQRRSRALAYVTGAILGAGVYSYLAAAIMMPVYLVATLTILATQRDRRAAVAVAVAFAVTLLPLALWQAVEPHRYSNMLSAYRLVEPDAAARAGTLRALFSASSLEMRANVYWDAFNPSRLFFSGESSLQISTREVGSLLTPVGGLIVAAAWALTRTRQGPMAWLLVFGLLTAPLPAAVMADVEIRRWLVVMPFVATLAGLGAGFLLSQGRWLRALCVALIVLSVVQFLLFTRDYFGSYRERSSFWFGGNIRAAVDRVLREPDEPSAVIIATEIPWVDAYWRFYTTAEGRESLLDRTQYARLAEEGVPPAAENAVIVTPAADEALSAALNAAGWTRQQTIPDLDGRPSLTVARAAVAAAR